MPQTEAITVPEHNVPVRENMSRVHTKNWPCNETQRWIQPRRLPRGFAWRVLKWIIELVTPSLFPAAFASQRYSRSAVAASPSRGRCHPRRWNWFWRMSVVNLSASVGISTRASHVFETFSSVHRRPVNSAISQDISFAPFGIVNALRLSRIWRS